MKAKEYHPPTREETIKALATNIAAMCRFPRPLDEVQKLFTDLPYIDTVEHLNFDGCIRKLGYENLLSLMINNPCFYHHFDVFVQFLKKDDDFRVYIRYKDLFKKFVNSSGNCNQEVPQNAIIIENCRDWKYLLPNNQPDALEGRIVLTTILLKAGDGRSDNIPLHKFDQYATDSPWLQNKKRYFPKVGGQLNRMVREYCFQDVVMYESKHLTILKLLIGPDEVEKLRELRSEALKFWARLEILRYDKFGRSESLITAEEKRKNEFIAMRANVAKPVSFKMKKAESGELKLATEYSRIQPGRIAVFADSEVDSAVDENEFQLPKPNAIPNVQLESQPVVANKIDLTSNTKVIPPDELLYSDGDSTCDESDNDENDLPEPSTKSVAKPVQNMSFHKERCKLVSASSVETINEEETTSTACLNQKRDLSSTLSFKTSTTSLISVDSQNDFGPKVDYVAVPFEEHDCYVRFNETDIIALWDELAKQDVHDDVDSDLEALKSADITLPPSEDDDVFEDAVFGLSTESETSKQDISKEVDVEVDLSKRKSFDHMVPPTSNNSSEMEQDSGLLIKHKATAASELPAKQQTVLEIEKDRPDSPLVVNRATDVFSKSGEDVKKLKKPVKNVILTTPPPCVSRKKFVYPSSSTPVTPFVVPSPLPASSTVPASVTNVKPLTYSNRKTNKESSHPQDNVLSPTAAVYHTFMPQDDGEYVKLEGTDKGNPKSTHMAPTEASRASNTSFLDKNATTTAGVIIPNKPQSFTNFDREASKRLDMRNISEFNQHSGRSVSTSNTGSRFSNKIQSLPATIKRSHPFQLDSQPLSTAQTTNGRSFSTKSDSSGLQKLDSGSVTLPVAHLNALRDFVLKNVGHGEFVKVHELHARLDGSGLLSPYAMLCLFSEFEIKVVDGKEVIKRC